MNRIQATHIKANTGTHAIRLVAPHGSSGNPRRVWLILNPSGAVVGTHWEGYSGELGCSAEWPDVDPYLCPTINLPNAVELKAWRGKTDIRHTEG